MLMKCYLPNLKLVNILFILHLTNHHSFKCRCHIHPVSPHFCFYLFSFLGLIFCRKLMFTILWWLRCVTSLIYDVMNVQTNVYFDNGKLNISGEKQQHLQEHCTTIQAHINHDWRTTWQQKLRKKSLEIPKG